MTSAKIGRFTFATSALAVAATVSSVSLAADKSAGPLKVAIFSVNAASPTIHTMIEFGDRGR